MLQTLKASLARVSLVALLTSMVSFSAYAQDAGPFPDVGSDHPNITAIQFMKDSGVFEGYPDGTYQPDRVLNRAEQLKVYMILHGYDAQADAGQYKNCFPDVNEEWFARFVCFAKKKGWVQGYPDGTFKPAQEVNKVEALKMLGQIEGWAMTEPTTPSFDDTPTGEWYSKYVEFAKNAGLLVEKSGNFNPAEGLSRSSTAELLFRSLAVYALGEDAYSPTLDEQIKAIDVDTLAALAAAAPVAEYGDAPESGPAGYAGPYSTVEAAFPTLHATTNSSGPGAHALDSSMEWLGENFSYEEDANDPADPDGVMNLDNADDYDDGVKGLTIELTSIPPPATLSVGVSVDAGAPNVPRYLNAVIDLNMDGKWGGHAAGGEPEWVVQNMPVNVPPGTTETIVSGQFAYSHGWVLTPTTWIRVVFSREPIDAAAFGADGWDGSGEFAYGEVEDYYIQLPNWGDNAGGPGGRNKGGRGLVWGKPAPVMICPKKVIFPTNVNQVFFRCMVYNFGGQGNNAYNLWWIAGNVTVFPVAGQIFMPTAPPGFRGFGVVGNPSPLWFNAWKFGQVQQPSTWGYKIVGIDPESSVNVNEGTIDVGLVPADKDEGYSGGTLEDILSWADELDDYYLFGDGLWSGPLIVDATFLEMDTVAGQYHFVGVPHVRCAEGECGSLDYTWTSPTSCGLFDLDPATGILDWTFDEADAAECLEGGLDLSVSSETGEDAMAFHDAFANHDALSTPANTPPEIQGIEAQWLNNMEDDPHLYNLTLSAFDADGDTLSYEWMSIDCGSFNTGTASQTVGWQYAQADMNQCSSAQATVEVSDGTDTVQATVPVFP